MDPRHSLGCEGSWGQSYWEGRNDYVCGNAPLLEALEIAC